MNILDKIAKNKNNPGTTIAFLGDSVTEGCFRGYNNYEKGYHNVLKRKLEVLCPSSVINIINAGIGGSTSVLGAERLERDIISKNPDLCVVCFGLNEVGGLEKGLPVFINALSEIFEKLKNAGCEVIYMTPNMMNEKIITELVEDVYAEYAEKTMKWQNEGMMDRYMNEAIETAKKYDIPVCDCYGKWKKLAEHGVDVTALLCNGINHPNEKMHELFASSLLDVMIG